MSRGWRAFYGAAIGALIVLLLHGASRPFLLTSLLHWGPSKAFSSSKLLLENYPVLASPTTPLEASLWMQAGAEKLRNKLPIQKSEFDQLVTVADRAADLDRDNAYW